MTIFVSHSSLDGDLVRSLVRDLQGAGSPVWLDQDLTGGEAWWSAILKQIRGCDVFVLALSPNALDSEACMLELGYARDLQRPIVTVQIADLSGMRDHFVYQYQTIDYRRPTAASGIALIRAINEREREAQPLPDPLPAPPAIPYEYLMLLGTAIRGRAAILPADQESILKQLRQALRDERNASVRDNVRTLLAVLRERPEVTYRTVTEIDEILQNKAEPGGNPTGGAGVQADSGQRPTAPTPGWYPDPAGGPRPRYWDGKQWAAEVQRVAQAVQPGPQFQPRAVSSAPIQPARPASASKAFSITAFAFGAVALVIPVVGLIGVGFGIAAAVRKERLGVTALVVVASVSLVAFVVWGIINR